MSKRLTDTDIWDKEWFMALSPKLKCLVKFVWDKCDLAGVWSPNWVLAKIYIGEPVSEIDLLSIDNGNQFLKLPTGKFFCPDFISFQNGILGEKSPIHKKIFSLLQQHNIPYTYPINKLIVNVIVEEEVVVEENVKVIDAKIEEILNSEKWIGNTSIIEKLPLEKTRERLIYFLKDQENKKEIEHRSLQEIKNHFCNWLKINKEKDSAKKESYGRKQVGTKAGQEHPLANLDNLANAIIQGHSGTDG